MTWKPVTGSLKRISVGSETNVWGVNAAGKIYRYTQGDDAANPWINVPGGLTDIGAAADGTVWGVNANVGGGNIFRYVDNGTWTSIPGALTAISVGSRTNVWGVNAAGGIFRYTQNDANPWIAVPGRLTDIGAAADGTVWGVNTNVGGGNIFRYMDNGTWTPIAGALTAISAGSRTNVWGVNAASSIYCLHARRCHSLGQYTGGSYGHRSGRRRYGVGRQCGGEHLPLCAHIGSAKSGRGGSRG